MLANIINVLLDLLLIFGWEPFVPAMGISGAAIATGVSQTFQALVLFCAFFKKSNRINYGTGAWQLKIKPFIECIKVGFPNAFAHVLEILAWVVFMRMMTSLGHEYITVVAVAQSIFFLFTFITEGISKGASAIAANMIGAKEWHLVWKLFRSGVKFYCQVFLVLGLVLVVFPEPLIRWFIPMHAAEASEPLVVILKDACFWVWIFFLFDGITWLSVGLLTAAGDTRFVMKVGSLSVWLFALVPIYIFVVRMGHKADVAWLITAFYGFMNCCIYLWRLRSGKWKANQIITD